MGGDGHIFRFDLGLFESLTIYSKKSKQNREIHIVENIDLGPRKTPPPLRSRGSLEDPRSGSSQPNFISGSRPKDSCAGS